MSYNRSLIIAYPSMTPSHEFARFIVFLVGTTGLLSTDCFDESYLFCYDLRTSNSIAKMVLVSRPPCMGTNTSSTSKQRASKQFLRIRFLVVILRPQVLAIFYCRTGSPRLRLAIYRHQLRKTEGTSCPTIQV